MQMHRALTKQTLPRRSPRVRNAAVALAGVVFAALGSGPGLPCEGGEDFGASAV